ncbi:SulP family inorganic anion transporter [uncultured Corynebacterium sp.]|uniref:SulP family inorganic anion transporter n=1 Tax=uncultured Corynebacterium sp. TaxID=159447 RepID=UPI0025DA1525|nr:SulP family inorganic anion transporter [uncultured Corynebacterium sp.]
MTIPTTVGRWLPGLTVARGYRREWLRHDITAGVALTALLIPAGLGYAEVAGLPPVTGLYATIVPLLVYAVLGPSRILVLGPDSSLAPIIAAAVVPLAVAGPERVALAGVLALEVGVALIIAAVLRLGALTSLLARPIRIGYLNGIALAVVVGQLPTLLGFAVDADSLSGEVTAIARGIADGAVDLRAAALGIGSVLVILVLARCLPRIPGVLVAVVAATVVVVVAGWRGEVPVVGEMPRGFPTPALGGVSWDDAVSLVIPALGIALIAFTDTGVLSRTFAARDGRHIDSNREMSALGGANIASGLLGGFPVSASNSRTPVADRAGARTQLTSVVGAGLLVLALIAVPWITADLPRAALAAVVITAAASLVDLGAVTSLFRVDRTEGLICLAATAGVAVLGVLEGIVVAVVLAFVAFVKAVSRPYRVELGRVAGVRGFHDVTRHPQARPVAGTVLLRFDAPLFFANGAVFDDWVRDEVLAARERGRVIERVVLACEPITGLDSSAVEELVELDDYLRRHGIRLYFAEMKDPVREKLSRYRLTVDGVPRFSPDRFAPTVGAIVDRIENGDVA